MKLVMFDHAPGDTRPGVLVEGGVVDASDAVIGGLGVDVPIDVGPDGMWTPGERLTHTFWINLTKLGPLEFFGDLMGVTESIS